MNFKFLTLSSLFLIHSLFSSTAITLYNQGFGVIRENIDISLKKGMNQVQFDGVTRMLETDSIIFREKNDNSNFYILEQNYRNDPINEESLLKHYEGQQIQFQTEIDGHPHKLNGKIIRAPSMLSILDPFENRAIDQFIPPIIELNGQWHTSLPGTPIFPPLQDTTLLKPTLLWKIQSKETQKMSIELAYLSKGFAWEASYNLVSPENSNVMKLHAWITLKNTSGANFKDTKIKLVAGEVSKIQKPNYAVDPFGDVATASMRISARRVEEKSLDEYHMYSVPFLINFRHNEQKQIELLYSDGVQSKKIYQFNRLKSNSAIRIYREFQNTEENHLGMPLPAGKVRFYKKDLQDHQLEFIGENIMNHTPKNESVSIYTGDAFDILGKRSILSSNSSKLERTRTESIEIQLTNRKKEKIEIQVLEPIRAGNLNWKVTKSSHPFEKIDNKTLEFKVPVSANSKEKIQYTLLFSKEENVK